MREVFIPYKPHASTLVVVEQANTIIDEYLAQGFALTLRQLFYQFVAAPCSRTLSSSTSASGPSSAMPAMAD
jgi:hypothetical protein